MPVQVLPTRPELARPYLTAAQFTAYPSWLDLDNLIPGGVASVQTDELTDILLQASRWADNICDNMRLSAHLVSGENQRTTVGRVGRITIRPRDIPLRGIVSLSYGWDPSSMITLGLPVASMWIEAGRRVSFSPGAGQSFTGPAIQFGNPPAPESAVYVTWSYVAGYPSATIASAAANASSITLSDPTGVLPGDVLRIYDSGVSEALTVASTYTPANPTIPPTPTAVPLAANTLNAHAAGTGVTGFPREILQAVICYTVALLMREDVADEVPQSRFGPASRTTTAGRGGQAGGLINDAEQLLAPYRPTFRTA